MCLRTGKRSLVHYEVISYTAQTFQHVVIFTGRQNYYAVKCNINISAKEN